MLDVSVARLLISAGTACGLMTFAFLPETRDPLISRRAVALRTTGRDSCNVVTTQIRLRSAVTMPSSRVEERKGELLPEKSLA